MVLHGPIEARNQAFFAERLAQEPERSALKRALLNALLRIAGDEINRSAMAACRQMALQVDPTHAWHLHVRDQARGIAHAARLEKRLGGGESRRRVAQRLDEHLRCYANGPVVVND